MIFTFHAAFSKIPILGRAEFCRCRPRGTDRGIEIDTCGRQLFLRSSENLLAAPENYSNSGPAPFVRNLGERRDSSGVPRLLFLLRKPFEAQPVSFSADVFTHLRFGDRTGPRLKKTNGPPFQAAYLKPPVPLPRFIMDAPAAGS